MVACVRTYDKPRSNEHRCQRSPGQRVKRMGSHDNESGSLHSAVAGSCELPRTPPTCSHVPNLTRTAHTSLSAFEACGEVGSVICRSASVSPSPGPRLRTRPSLPCQTRCGGCRLSQQQLVPITKALTVRDGWQYHTHTHTHRRARARMVFPLQGG